MAISSLHVWGNDVPYVSPTPHDRGAYLYPDGKGSPACISFTDRAHLRRWLLSALDQLDAAEGVHPPRNERQTWESGVVPSLGYDPFGDTQPEADA